MSSSLPASLIRRRILRTACVRVQPRTNLPQPRRLLTSLIRPPPLPSPSLTTHRTSLLHPPPSPSPSPLLSTHSSSPPSSSISTSSISPSSYASNPSTPLNERHSDYGNSLPYPLSSVYIYPIGHGCRHIILNRPAALNALTLPMVRRLSHLLDAVTLDVDVGVVLMSGAGTRAFCAGGDVRALHDAGLRRKAAGAGGVRGEGTGESDLTKAFFKEEYALNWKLHCMRVPLVAVLNGIVMGGGVGLSAHGRYRVAMPESTFAMPECAIGFFPDVGASFLLPRLFHPYLGHYLGLTGARLKGYDLLHAGVATHWTDSVEYPAHVEATYNLNGMTWQQAEDAVENVFWHTPEPDVVPPFSLTPQQLQLIADVFSLPTIEQMLSSLSDMQHEHAASSGSSSSSSSSLAPFVAATLKALRSASPLSLKVTLELLKRGALMPLERCLEMEYRVSQRMMMGSDFYAGVNSALISKDRKPQWQHADVAQVTDDEVAAFFQPLEGQEELQLAYPKYEEPQWYI